VAKIVGFSTANGGQEIRALSRAPVFQDCQPPKDRGTCGGNRARVRHVFELLQKLKFDPVETLTRFARGDAVALGFMTQEEYDAPKRIVDIGGARVELPSGHDIALQLIPPSLRQKSTESILPYTYPRIQTLELTDTEGESLAGRVIVLPANGRLAKKVGSK
jgi:hypothetical protein